MAKKRSGQWFGDRVSQTVQLTPDTSEVIQLLEPADALESIRDIVFERCIINFTVTRLLTTEIEDLSWMAWKGTVATGSTIPLEALNPRSAAQTTLSTGSIMQVGSLPFPPKLITFDSAGAIVTATASQEGKVHEVDFHVKRSINRGNEGVFLTLAASLDNVVRVSVQFRTYYTYA